MSQEYQCPLCYRQHEVADDGTIPTWVVTWEGQESVAKRYLSGERQQRLEMLREKYGCLKREPKEGFISNRSTRFIHYGDAISEYNWIKGILVQRGDWEEQNARLH